ncbi:MAG: hypothetical protein CMB52_05530 [Euryarchaeota archaeon]|nr:hypothetical protein [Euryarchaeota archaeon]MBJ84958.1 hypothetical protein [Euryarchaeota archaeon]
MKWEVKELPDGRWGIFLCKKYWKFKDKPVMYSASVSKELAEQRVYRLNNPNGYSNDEKCYTVGMARADAKKKREQAKKEKAEAAKAKREAKKK